MLPFVGALATMGDPQDGEFADARRQGGGEEVDVEPEKRLDERQRMDLIFTIGGYIALAMALNAFGVEPDKER